MISDWVICPYRVRRIVKIEHAAWPGAGLSLLIWMSQIAVVADEDSFS